MFQGFQFEERIPRVLPDVKDGPKVHMSQMHRNEAVLHSLVREWSDEGIDEIIQKFVDLIFSIGISYLNLLLLRETRTTEHI